MEDIKWGGGVEGSRDLAFWPILSSYQDTTLEPVDPLDGLVNLIKASLFRKAIMRLHDLTTLYFSSTLIVHPYTL